MSELDDEIRTHFADLRADDATHAPRFSAIWNEAHAISPRRKNRSAWWAFVAASAVIAVALIARGERRSADAPDLPDSATYPSLTSWQSPTGGLLPRSRSSTISPTSSFGSVLDAVTSPATQSETPKGGRL